MIITSPHIHKQSQASSFSFFPSLARSLELLAFDFYFRVTSLENYLYLREKEIKRLERERERDPNPEAIFFVCLFLFFFFRVKIGIPFLRQTPRRRSTPFYVRFIFFGRNLELVSVPLKNVILSLQGLKQRPISFSSLVVGSIDLVSDLNLFLVRLWLVWFQGSEAFLVYCESRR